MQPKKGLKYELGFYIHPIEDWCDTVGISKNAKACSTVKLESHQDNGFHYSSNTVSFAVYPGDIATLDGFEAFLVMLPSRLPF